MSDLKKLLLSFTQNHLAFSKLPSFKLNYLGNSKLDGFLPIVFDRKHKVNCILNLFNSDFNEQINNSPQIIKLAKIEVTDSNWDILFFKHNNSIKCALTLIINECTFKDVEKKVIPTYYDNLQNLNFIDEIQKSLEKFIFDYLKVNFKSESSFPHWIISEDIFRKKTLPASNFNIENILLGYQSFYQGKIHLLYNKQYKLNCSYLKTLINKIEGMMTSVEICPNRITEEDLKWIMDKNSSDDAYKNLFCHSYTIEGMHNKNISRSKILEK